MPYEMALRWAATRVPGESCSSSATVLCWSQLVSLDLEIPFLRTVSIRTRHGSIVGTDVVELPVGDELHHVAVRILRIRFQMKTPFGRIQSGGRDRYAVRARVDQTGNLLAIPAHDQSHLGAAGGIGPPVASPCSAHRKSLLSRYRYSRRNAGQS